MDKGEKEGKTAIKSWGARKVLRVKKEVEVNTRENGEREEDCYILDSDPNDSLIIIDLSKLSISSDLDATDISVLAEKGQCYCFVCDRVAPCKKWYGVTGHCHAIDSFYWTCRRRDQREKKTKPTNALI